MVCLSDTCFNSGTIQWSPLKHLRVGENLLNGQACDFPDFSGILVFGNFLKGPIHPVFTYLKSAMETPE